MPNEARENTKIAELQALLFQYGEPVPLEKAASLLSVSENEASAFVDALAERLDSDPASGLTVLRNGGAVQLVTKPALKDTGEKIMQEEFREELTPAALETLSLVAYLGPVSRSTIDYVRGVNSSFTMRNLLMRGLVERFHGGAGHAYEYRVSFDFLKHMGLDDVRHLPDYGKYREIFEKFEAQEREASFTPSEALRGSGAAPSDAAAAPSAPETAQPQL